jgi:predicted HAD superfamily Cof-like phosphohydrolase
MKSAMEMVAEFHRKHGMPRSEVPCVTEDAQRRILRLELIREEVDELREALGLVDGNAGTYAHDRASFVDTADALADIAYLVIGSAVEWGIPLPEILEEVHRSNMTKEPGNNRADGKILKGPGYSPPDIAGVLWGDK